MPVIFALCGHKVVRGIFHCRSSVTDFLIRCTRTTKTLDSWPIYNLRSRNFFGISIIWVHCVTFLSAITHGPVPNLLTWDAEESGSLTLYSHQGKRDERSLPVPIESANPWRKESRIG